MVSIITFNYLIASTKPIYKTSKAFLNGSSVAFKSNFTSN